MPDEYPINNSDEMLDDLVDQLKMFEPASTKIDRERIVFEAGKSCTSKRINHYRWICSALCFSWIISFVSFWSSLNSEASSSQTAESSLMKMAFVDIQESAILSTTDSPISSTGAQLVRFFEDTNKYQKQLNLAQSNESTNLLETTQNSFHAGMLAQKFDWSIEDILELKTKSDVQNAQNQGSPISTETLRAHDLSRFLNL